MGSITTKKIKLRLKEILREQGRYQGWLAGQLGVSMGAVTIWCAKKGCPGAGTLSRIAEILGIEKSELYERGEEGWSKFLPKIFKP